MNFLKMVAIWVLGPVVVALGLGWLFFGGYNRMKYRANPSGFRVDTNGKWVPVGNAQQQRGAQQ